MGDLLYQDTIVASIVLAPLLTMGIIFVLSQSSLALLISALYLLFLTISFFTEQKMLFLPKSKSVDDEKALSIVAPQSICLGIFFAITLPIIMTLRGEPTTQQLLSFEMMVILVYVVLSWTLGSVLGRHLFRRKSLSQYPSEQSLLS